MMKNYPAIATTGFLLFSFLLSCTTKNSHQEAKETEDEKYDGPMARAAFEFERIKDPALGYVPEGNIVNAVNYTEALKASLYGDMDTYGANGIQSGIWEERGPSYDSVGPSNGNGRGSSGSVAQKNAGGSTSGRVRAVLIDKADPTGNTVLAGGVNGGLWRCTNFLDAIPNWQHVTEDFDNLSLSSICQLSGNPSIMYFATGEATSNADAVYGAGVWKSTDAGITWNRVSGSLLFQRIFKIVCDNEGNIYVANRNSNLSGGVTGLFRSTDGGASFVNITPTGLASGNTCTDLELSSTGRFHASFGYSTGTVAYRYTDAPSTVSAASGWVTGAGITTTGNRLELAVLGDTLYAAPTNTSNNLVSTYRSYDGGANWVLNNTTLYTNSISNTQGWYNITLAINPDNAAQIIVAGLDAYRSLDTGKTMTKLTSWVNSMPYVHADHHFLQWHTVGGESRILMGCDGGLFFSRNNGSTWADKNRNLRIKQFYSVAIHPTQDYFLAGAQDNGSHQFKNPGLSYTWEVRGGDGCFVQIDQNEPLFQFISVTNNNYGRTVDGGNTWSTVTLSSSQGLFVNPTDYDNTANILYCSNGVSATPNNQFRRWNDAQTGSNNTVITMNEMVKTSVNTNVTAVTVSPNVANRVYFGGNTGRLLRLENANTVANSTDVTANVTDITGINFPNGYLNCIAVGNNDDNLVAIFSNYGINNVWHSSDAGVTWTGIDNNLPNMPIRWAVFDPNDNDKLVIGTEAGIYTTRDIDGLATNWIPAVGFPTCRVDMIKVRPSDGLMAVATHGRGLWTSTIAQALPIKNVKLQATSNTEGIANLAWTTYDETNKTKYVVQYSTDGVSFTKVAELPYNKKQFLHNFQAATGYYRIMATEPGQSPIFSNVVSIKNTGKVKGIQLKVAPNPVTTSNASFIISNSDAGNYNWMITDMAGRTLQTGQGNLPAGGSKAENLNLQALPAGMYRIKVVQGNKNTTAAFIKQ